MFDRSLDSLSTFISSVGKNVFIFRGTGRFETLLAGFFSHNIWREENNFLYVPEISERDTSILSAASVRLSHSDEGEKKITIFAQDFNEEAGCLLSKCKKIYPLIACKNEGGLVGVSSAPHLPIDVSVHRSLAESVGLPTPYDLDEMIESGYKAVVTTDWRVFVEAKMFGVPSMLIMGPAPPSWVTGLSSPQFYYSDLRDTSPMSACRCLNVASCHSADDVKPCVRKAPWDRVSNKILVALS